MRKAHLTLGLTALVVTGITGCEILEPLLSELQDLGILGVMPAAGFSDPVSPDYGKVTLAIAGRDASGFGLAPAFSGLEVEDDTGEDVDVEDGETVPGHEAGSFALLVDGSASLESTDSSCEGCPTDPERKRVDAAQVLAERLAECGGGWRQSLMEFSSENGGLDYTYTDVLAEFGSDAEAISSAADTLDSDGGTPLWDATYEVLDALVADSQSAFGEDGSVTVDEDGIALVVISDGADTGSDTSLDALIAHALDLGVPIHAVGLGPASDGLDEFWTEPAAIADLRRLASETGGYYGYVADPDELPALADNIATAACGGYTELTARFSAPPESGSRVSGKVRLSGTPLAVPFSFSAP